MVQRYTNGYLVTTTVALPQKAISVVMSFVLFRVTSWIALVFLDKSNDPKKSHETKHERNYFLTTARVGPQMQSSRQHDSGFAEKVSLIHVSHSQRGFSPGDSIARPIR